MRGAVLYELPQVSLTDASDRVEICAGTIVLCEVTTQTNNKTKQSYNSRANGTGRWDYDYR